MAKLYARSLFKPSNLSLEISRWIRLLPNSFSVFVDVEGSDFHADLLVFKNHGIFNIQISTLPVTVAAPYNDWTTAGGANLRNPFPRLLDQCQKIADYIIVQREEIFGRVKAGKIWNHRDQLRIFPCIVIPTPDTSYYSTYHAFRRIFFDSASLNRHLQRFEWFPHGAKLLRVDHTEVVTLAKLFHLEELDSTSLLPKSSAPSRPPDVIAEMSYPSKQADSNPYQFSYSVTGQDFYGRSSELRLIRQGLIDSPAVPIAITGLQRTGKSSLVQESIRRHIAGSAIYRVIEFDFRKLRSEPLTPDHDITLDFMRGLAHEQGSDINREMESYHDRATKSGHVDQQRIFVEALKYRRSLNKRSILFLDECQDVASSIHENRYKRFFAFLDTLCRDPTLGLNIILASRPAFFELKEIKSMNLGRLFNTINLGPLDEQAALAIIQHGEDQLEFEEDAKRRILFLTGRHPFWVQRLCHRIYQDCLLREDSYVTVNVVNGTFYSIVEDPGCKPQFFLLYQDVEDDPVAMRVIKGVAAAANDEGSRVNVSKIPADGAERDIARALMKLREYKILELATTETHTEAWFQIEALRVWLRQNLFAL